LIDTEKRWSRQQFAYAIKQQAQLARSSNVPAENDDTTGLNLFNEVARFRV
jgi:hypothetical protein